jgi:predicted dehydrogenase
VTCHENHRAADRVIELGLPMLLETPLAMNLRDAARLAERIEASGLPVEIAEQNPRSPSTRLWTRIVQEGFIGEVRMVASDGAGYRYHATAVARALLGRPVGLRASGVRVLTEVDLGRGIDREPLMAGTILTRGGAIFQLREGEGHHLGSSAPWLGGGWHILGDRGSIASPDRVRRWAPGDSADVPVERVGRTIDGVDVTQLLRLHGKLLLEVSSPAPEAPLDDDGQAVAQCVKDWLSRLDGKPSPTGWSAADALADLEWIDAMERSALLGGAPISLQPSR